MGALVAGTDLPTYTKADIENHKGGQWVIIKDRVYNLEEILKTHPGGDEVIRSYRGKDATEIFKTAHNPRWGVKKRLNKFCIGRVVSERVAPGKVIHIPRRSARLRKTYSLRCRLLAHYVKCTACAVTV